MSNINWVPTAPFSHDWPKHAGAPRNEEHFDKGVQSDAEIGKQKWPITIGFTFRDAAGRSRRRAVVFVNGIPAVEFTGTDDFKESHLLASVVKGKDGKHIRRMEDIPAEYVTFPTDIYTNLITGPYAARSVAVVANEGDFTLMARHAMIRALWKGRLG